MENQIAVQNLALLNQHHPETAKGLLAYLQEQRSQRAVPQVRVEQAGDRPVLIWMKEGQSIPLPSDVQIPTHLSGSAILYSCGLGEIPCALAERLTTLRLVIIEPEWDILFAALQECDWTQALQSSHLYFLCGKNALEEANQLIRRYGSLFKKGAHVFAGRALLPEEEAILSALRDEIIESQKRFQRKKAHARAVTDQRIAFASGDAQKELLTTLCFEARKMGFQCSPVLRKAALNRFLHTEEMWWESTGLPLPYAILSFTRGVFFSQEWFQWSRHGVKRYLWCYDDPFRNDMREDFFQCFDRIYCFDPVLTYKIKTVTNIPAEYMPAATSYAENQNKQKPSFIQKPPAISFVGSTGIQRFGVDSVPFLTQPGGSFSRLREWVDSFLERGQRVPYDELLALDLPLPVEGISLRTCWLEDLATLAVRLHFLSALIGTPTEIYGDRGWSIEACVGRISTLYRGHASDFIDTTPWIYANSAISLNTFNLQCINSPTIRMLDVMACGGFLLTEYRPFMDNSFRIGEELDVFRTQTELREKAAFYLNHSAERQRIAQAGQRRVFNEYRYRNRFQAIFQEILDLGIEKPV